MVVIQGTSTIWPRVLQVCTYPVNNGHEVVTYCLYAAFAQIGKAYFVVFN